MSVTVSREALSLAPLAIGGAPTLTVPLWVPEDGVSEPDLGVRLTYAPDSAYIPGRRPLAAVLDAGEIPLIVYARAQSSHTLAQAKALLEAAVGQWAYEATVEAITYPAWMARPRWGPVDSGMTKEGIARCTLSIPVNPPGA